MLYLGKLVDPKFVCLVPGNPLETPFTSSPYPSLGIEQTVFGVDDLRSTAPAGTDNAEGMVLQRGQPVNAAIDEVSLDPATGVTNPTDGLDYHMFL